MDKLTQQELLDIAEDIRNELDKVREDMCLSFEEEEHKYEMLDKNGELTSDLPSVSTLLKKYFSEFDSDVKSLEMCENNNPKAEPFLIEANYDVKLAAQLLRESWQESGRSASAFGSYTHYKLEQYLWNLYDIDKDLRKPIYTLNEEELVIGQELTKKGVDMIHTLIGHGFVPLDTEVIMGSVKYGYFGQADNIWLGQFNGKLVLIMTDWKTNKSKNMETIPMFHPFLEGHLSILRDNTLSKYKMQQILYSILFKEMLSKTKYSELDFVGWRIMKLRDEPEMIKIETSLYTSVKKLLDENEDN